MPLSSVEARLLDISAFMPRTDWVLQTLVSATDLPAASIGLSITVLVSGYLIRGSLMGTRQYVEQLDHDLDAGMREAAERYDHDDERNKVAQAWRTEVAGVFSRQLEMTDEADLKHFQALEEFAQKRGVSARELRPDELPEDLAVTLASLRGPRSVLTLENAVMLIPPVFSELPVGIVRVHTSHVAAWWTQETGGSANE